MSKRIVIVEDHPIVREGYAQLINHEDGLSVVGQAATASEGLEVILATLPDLALVDLSLKGSSGLDLIKDLSKQAPAVRVLVISLHDENVYAERVLKAGARGYIMKNRAVDSVMEAIHQVLEDKVYLSPEMNMRMLQRLAGSGIGSKETGLEALSDREFEVLQLIGQGFKSRNIAEQLNLSVKTVDTYKTNLKTKLQLKDAVELMQYAMQWNLKRDS